MNSSVDFLLKNEKLPFTPENMFKRFSYITFFPLQANGSSSKDEDGKITSWFQILSHYKTFYASNDENGVLLSDSNATLNTLIVKFPFSYLNKYKLTIDMLKTFFNENYVNKSFLTLPVTEETPVYEYRSGIRNLIKNQSQVFINDDFDLMAFISSQNAIKSKK